MVQRVTNEALQIHGHLGYTNAAAVQRYYRDARGFTLGGGTSETVRNMLAREIIESATTTTTGAAAHRT
jgi:alkylation response protein AidB-like acyl-CoA dehydrogenase